ncbi:MAG: DUF58 domain-containing protein [Elusimicrobia bacterium]|nr:DUF58 domain-containing protein [Candidatus Obscuribacterium magneticum]
MPTSAKSPLDPIVIAQLGNLRLRARRILDGLYSGHHTSPLYGSSQEFSEHRAYHPGDEPKTLDWKAFGRTDRLVVKRFEEETNIAALLLIDDSASMDFSWGGRPSKLDYAKTMAAALAYLLVSQHDGVGLITRSTTLPASSQRGHLEQFFRLLDPVVSSGIWDYARLPDQIGPLTKKRSLLIILSDLLTDSDPVISVLRSLHARKHEVIVFHILDPAETTLPFEGPILFEDAETKDLLKTDPEAIRDAYRSIVKEKISTFSTVFRGAGMDYHFLTTDLPFDRGLGAYLAWREAHR